MKIKFNFSYKTTIICLILILGALRASYWQYERHIQKQEYIKLLNSRLEAPIEEINNLLKPETNWSDLIHRRLEISGEYDFENEIVIANRRYDDTPGKHVITPLKIDGSEQYILVNRGFLPLELSYQEKRKEFWKPKEQSFVGLVKEPKERKFFLQPRDPEPQAGKFYDNWLRVNPKKISLQTGYELLPIYVEIMNTVEQEAASKQIVKSDAGKSDMLFMGARADSLDRKTIESTNYPIPIFDTVVPPGRHFGYIFEWIIIAFIIFCMGLILQLRRH